MSENAMLAPVVIAVGMKRQEIEKIPELDEIQAVACAVQNMHLTAAAHGLGGFWSTNVAAVSDAMREFIGLGPKDRALGLFYLGYPESDWPASERQPIDDKVRWLRE
jgi:nitroreductase